ncbi:MAG TPA: enoyl-CoA hydratase-related protein [Steroidobacteraceae bacterium]|jgi:methylglutaconyl-CoA hydratase|nr:enoyl-CoA hydratase-related protein [Steroidobacteraceae bacterium]
MTDYQFIQLERRDLCATVWLNRPERHNALHAGLILELQRSIDELSQDGAVRAIVLAGRGESFCAGGDLDWMRQLAAAPFEDNVEDARRLAYTMRTLSLCTKPTIARVHGAALGGGLGLVAACDIALASRTAVFSAPETRLGLTPSTVAPYVIAAIGERAARRVFLTGERFDAEEAQRLGLLQEAVDAQALDERLDATLAALALGGPQSQAHCKWLLHELRGRDPSVQSLEGLEETARSLANVRAGEEAREGIAAFYAHRKPSWAP